jgi:anti-sigma factor RsiW
VTQLWRNYGFTENVNMSVPEENRLVDAVRRGRLSSDEEEQLQGFLAANPEQRALWEEEINLNQLLRQMPDVSLSSNFTARVVQRARGEREVRSRGPWGFWQRLVLGHWMPKAATVAALVGVGLLTYHQQQATARKEMARTLASLTLPANSVELLENFDAIQRLAQVPHEDDRDLIAALQ